MPEQVSHSFAWLIERLRSTGGIAFVYAMVQEALPHIDVDVQQHLLVYYIRVNLVKVSIALVPADKAIVRACRRGSYISS